MAKYWYDTEFHEYIKKPLFGKPYHTIDLLSIAMVSEDNSELYLINKEFDLKAAWKDEWLRNNVISPLADELIKEKIWREMRHLYDATKQSDVQQLINQYGITKEEIKQQIFKFTNGHLIAGYAWLHKAEDWNKLYSTAGEDHEFIGYYSAYDHVLFSSLYGRMLNLPPGFPMYTTDLQQMIDQKGIDKAELLRIIPQENNHSALCDARWIKKAYTYVMER
jgi:hypothetical protein